MEKVLTERRDQMNIDRLREHIEALSRYETSKDIEQAVAELTDYFRQHPDLLSCVLTQYPYDKSVWDAKARVIAAQSDAVLEHYAAGVLDWLQDLNWPGSMRLFDRLTAVRKGRLDEAIAECIEFASVLNDEMWIEFLRELQVRRAKI